MLVITANDHEVILRSCAAEAQPCSPSGYAANKEIFCEVCKEEGCNGAFRQSSSIVAILLPVALWAIAAKFL
ncbi:hypothetical protein C0J52_04141 [Blattella germanica]|nr:hypothetical protein C0J52_04141 [Blattella germanica]